jgi:hypothetical protein
MLWRNVSKVPAIWYDAPKDADPSKPSEKAFILPESGLIVNFLADVFPQIAGELGYCPLYG